MSELTTFDFHGEQVRVTGDSDSPRFVGTDVLAILDLDRTAYRRLDDDEKGVDSIHTPGGEQNVTVVTESGLYSLILGSRKPSAREFKRWVTGEVLPSIRKTGGYGVTPALTEDQIVHQALQITAQRVQALEAENRVLAPKASRYDTFLGADGDLSLRDAAQSLSRDHGIKIGQNNLAKWMRANSWIDRRGIPYQHRIDAGHLRAKPRTYKHPRTGEDVVADPQVRVTPRGLDLLAERLAGPRLVEVSR